MGSLTAFFVEENKKLYKRLREWEKYKSCVTQQ